MSLRTELVEKIVGIVGEGGSSTAPADLYTYGFDSSIHHQNPDIVVRPTSTEQVSLLLHLANDERIPVVPRGAGTGLCGGAVPIEGGIVLDLTRMNASSRSGSRTSMRLRGRRCVRPPVGGAGEAQVRHTDGAGQFEACTIGGMVATNASGMRAIKYGAMRDYVLGLEVVLAGGDVIQVGGQDAEELLRLSAREVVRRQRGNARSHHEGDAPHRPEGQEVGDDRRRVPTLELAGKCVSRIIAKPIIPSAIELMDSTCIRAVNKTVKAGFPDAEALCMIEVDGEPESVEKEPSAVRQICHEVGATSVEFSADAGADGQVDLWTEEHHVLSQPLRRGLGIRLAGGRHGCADIEDS